MPQYLLALFLVAVFMSGAFPVGIVLALPLSVGVAHRMQTVLVEGDSTASSVFIGFSQGIWLRNVLYLSVRPVLAVSAFLLFSSALFYRILDFEFTATFIAEHELTLLYVATLSGILPAVMLLTPLSMVPYLLADKTVDVKTQNPIIESVKMLKEHYPPLVLIRGIYAIWLAFLYFLVLLFPFIFLAFVFSGESPEEPFHYHRWYWAFPLHILLVAPLYRLIHAVLYVELRQDKDTRFERVR